jgi:hypothetical protein
LAIALAVAGFLDDPLRLVASLLLILIVVMAGWTALVRGVARIGALRVRTPIDAPGVAPAAVAPHGVGLASVALLRVLSGRPAC